MSDPTAAEEQESVFSGVDDVGTSWPELLGFLFSHLVIISVVVASVTFVTVLLAYWIPPTYTAKALVLVERYKSPTLRSDIVPYSSDSMEAMQTEVELVLSRAVAEGVVDRLGLEDQPEDPPKLLARIRARLADWGLLAHIPRREGLIGSIGDGLEAENPAPANLISIEFTHQNPERAAQTAKAITDEYLELRLAAYTSNASKFLEERVADAESEVRRLRVAQARETSGAQAEMTDLKLQALERRYLFFSSKLDEARAEDRSDVSLTNVRVVDFPSVPRRPRLPRLYLIAAGFVAGLVLALSIALILEYFDHSVRSPRDIDAELGVPLLGSVSRASTPALRRLLHGAS